MAWDDDIDVLNAGVAANWSIISYFDQPTANDSSHTTPIYLEGTACCWSPLKKGGTPSGTWGYIATSTITGTPSMVGRLMVGFFSYPYAEIGAIPILDIRMRMSHATGFTTDFAEWDARAQIFSPKNAPISVHVPVMAYQTNPVATNGTDIDFSAVESVGIYARCADSADGKQGGLDWFFLISWVGAHSATLTNTFFSGLYSEYYDNEGQGLPGETSRPIGVLSKSGDFYQSNINFKIASGGTPDPNDTANTVISETGKTIYFANVEAEQGLGYIFVDPYSTYTSSFTLTGCVHFWNEQDGADYDNTGSITYTSTTIVLTSPTKNWYESGFAIGRKIRISGSSESARDGEYSVTGVTATTLTVTETISPTTAETNEATMSIYQPAKIFLDPGNAETFKLDGCSFSRGGEVDAPPYSTNRYINNCKFDDCKQIDIGDGTFEDNTVSNATLGVLYIGSTDTRRAKRTAYNNCTTAIEFDTVGNYDLDGDTFSGNTYDIENSDDASTITAGSFVVGRAYKILTVGTTDFTLIGSADNVIGTKFVATGIGTGTGTATEVLLINALNGADPSGAKVNNSGTNADTLIQNSVTITITVEDESGDPIQNVQATVHKDDPLIANRTEYMNEDTDATGEATESFNYPGSPVDIIWKTRKSETTDDPRYYPKSGTGQITSSGFTLSVSLRVNPYI